MIPLITVWSSGEAVRPCVGTQTSRHLTGRELVTWLQVSSWGGGALPGPRPCVVVVVGCFGAGGAGTFSSNGEEGAGLGGDDDARDSTDRASHHVSLCKIPTLSDRKHSFISFMLTSILLLRSGDCMYFYENPCCFLIFFFNCFDLFIYNKESKMRTFQPTYTAEADGNVIRFIQVFSYESKYWKHSDIYKKDQVVINQRYPSINWSQTQQCELSSLL